MHIPDNATGVLRVCDFSYSRSSTGAKPCGEIFISPSGDSVTFAFSNRFQDQDLADALRQELRIPAHSKRERQEPRKNIPPHARSVDIPSDCTSFYSPVLQVVSLVTGTSFKLVTDWKNDDHSQRDNAHFSVFDPKRRDPTDVEKYFRLGAVDVSPQQVIFNLRDSRMNDDLASVLRKELRLPEPRKEMPKPVQRGGWVYPSRTKMGTHGVDHNGGKGPKKRRHHETRMQGSIGKRLAH